jgi:hypothetical protein
MSNETVFERDKRIRASVLSMAQTFYLTTLNQFVGNNPDAWPSQTTLANSMNATTRAVRNWQTELEELGVIQVDVGKGRSSTNRYRLNLDSLQLKEEPRSAFSVGKEEPRSALMRNNVPVNEEPRSYRKNKNNQLKEQAFPFPTELNSEEFKTAWAEWVSFRREIKKKLTPSTVAKQLKELATWGPEKAARSIHQSIKNSWQGLFDPDTRSKAGSGQQTPETDSIWRTVEKAAHAHRFDLEKFRAAIGPDAVNALKSAGISAKQIDEAADFDRRQISKRFIQELTQQRATA